MDGLRDGGSDGRWGWKGGCSRLLCTLVCSFLFLISCCSVYSTIHLSIHLFIYLSILLPFIHSFIPVMYVWGDVLNGWMGWMGWLDEWGSDDMMNEEHSRCTPFRCYVIPSRIHKGSLIPSFLHSSLIHSLSLHSFIHSFSCLMSYGWWMGYGMNGEWWDDEWWDGEWCLTLTINVSRVSRGCIKRDLLAFTCFTGIV